MELWDRLDEVIGAALLAGVAAYSLYLGHVEIASLCAGGIISLLSVKASKKEV